MSNNSNIAIQANEFSKHIRAYIKNPSDRVRLDPECKPYRAAGWVWNVIFACLRGPVRSLAFKLSEEIERDKKDHGAYQRVMAMTGLTEEEYEQFLETVWSRQ